MNASGFKRISALGVVLFLSWAILAHPTYADDKSAKQNPPAAPVAPPPATASNAFNLLILSLQNDDYTGLLMSVDEDFKAALSHDLFESVAKLVAPHAQKGYTTTYWGSLNRKGFVVYHWKLTFKDGSDDMLGILSMKQDKIGGFALL